jgi:hypothetical protein
MKAQRAVDTILEKHWQEQVEQVASLFGWKKYHTLDSRRSDEDFPDLVLLRGRRQVVAELKRDGESARPGQIAWLEAFKAVGAETYVWRPSDFDLVSRILR